MKQSCSAGEFLFLQMYSIVGQTSVVASSQQGGYYSERPFVCVKAQMIGANGIFTGEEQSKVVGGFFCFSELLGCDLVGSQSTDGCGLLPGPLCHSTGMQILNVMGHDIMGVWIR